MAATACQPTDALDRFNARTGMCRPAGGRSKPVKQPAAAQQPTQPHDALTALDRFNARHASHASQLASAPQEVVSARPGSHRIHQTLYSDRMADVEASQLSRHTVVTHSQLQQRHAAAPPAAAPAAALNTLPNALERTNAKLQARRNERLACSNTASARVSEHATADQTLPSSMTARLAMHGAAGQHSYDFLEQSNGMKLDGHVMGGVGKMRCDEAMHRSRSAADGPHERPADAHFPPHHNRLRPGTTGSKAVLAEAGDGINSARHGRLRSEGAQPSASQISEDSWQPVRVVSGTHLRKRMYQDTVSDRLGDVADRLGDTAVFKKSRLTKPAVSVSHMAMVTKPSGVFARLQ